MQFLYPNVLSLLILLAILIFLISTNQHNIKQFFSKEILAKLYVGQNSMSALNRNIFLFISLILLIFSLARPVINEVEHNIKQTLTPIIIALDVSKSMYATDIYPSRIELAKKKLKQLIISSDKSMIGIVLFAQNSYIISPITSDFTSLKYIVDNLDTTLNFQNGSNILTTLEATIQMLQNFKSKNLIILSDGGNDDQYAKELELAKKYNIAIYTIGLATKTGSPIPSDNGYLTDKKGNIVTVSLNENIKDLALNSGGGYIDFSLDDNDIKLILNQIKKQSKQEEIQTKKIKSYTELFYYPLGLAIFCLLIAFSSLPEFKKIFLSLMFIAFFIYPQNNYANLLDFQTLKEAKENYNAGNYEEAIKNFDEIKISNERNYNLANSYYKNKQFQKAISYYNNVVTTNKNLEYQKLHNLGNSYVKEKNFKKAEIFYEKALKIKDDQETKENLEKVRKALKKKKTKKDKKKKKKEKKKESKQIKRKQQPISDMEEKKWMKELKKKKTPLLLQKVKSNQPQTFEINQPW